MLWWLAAPGAGLSSRRTAWAACQPRLPRPGSPQFSPPSAFTQGENLKINPDSDSSHNHPCGNSPGAFPTPRVVSVTTPRCPPHLQGSSGRWAGTVKQKKVKQKKVKGDHQDGTGRRGRGAHRGRGRRGGQRRRGRERGRGESPRTGKVDLVTVCAKPTNVVRPGWLSDLTGFA